MGLLAKVMERVAKAMPEKGPDPLLGKEGGYLGRGLSRADGGAKVTGRAVFTADVPLENVAHAVMVHGTIAKGRIAGIESEAATCAPGVILVMTYKNAPKMKAPHLMSVMNTKRGFAASELPTMQDDLVHWDGQAVAVVVAETVEQAEYGAGLVKVTYASEVAEVAFGKLKEKAVRPKEIAGEEPEIKIGDATEAFATSEVTIDQIYRTPLYNHNAIELHATTASWTGDESLMVFDTTQFVNGHRHLLADVFGLSAKNVRVAASFVGGGFGGKGSVWTQTLLCVAAAKLVKRPVKLVTTREGVFRIVGGRSLTEQRVALGAARDGTLKALIHTGLTATPAHARYAEQCTFPPRHLYGVENLYVGQKVVQLDMVANTWMRAPGESVGTFALESAMDELAYALRMDPIELRMKNEPARDPTMDVPFSSRHLRETYAMGAERFGWGRRKAVPRSQREGKWLVGQGVATAFYPVYRFPATVRMRILADGSVLVQAAGNEVGTDIATVQLQQIADRMGVAIEKVTFEYGDSALPDSSIMAGGSSQTVSIAAAMEAVVEKAQRQLLGLAQKEKTSVLAGVKYEEVEARDGGLFRKDNGGRGVTYERILGQAGEAIVEVEASSGQAVESKQYSMGSYGAQFCEVRVHEDTGEIRVARWVGAFDCGRVLNPRNVISQFRGGIIMGMGMALMEETIVDERRGRIMNRSLAEYHVPVNLDVPEIEVMYTGIADSHAPLGAHGVGEIGITGAAAAVANAVFHATGRRVRDLPITLEKVM